MMGDKQFKKCIHELTKLKTSKIILTKPNYKRSENPNVLFESVKKNKSHFEVKERVKEAFDYVKRISSPGDLILITGSFFLISEVLNLKR